MRGFGVNSFGVLRINRLISFIERTFTEAAEQTPRPKAGPRRRPKPRMITRGARYGRLIADESWRLRVRGANRLPRNFYPCRGGAADTRDFCVKPGSERPFYTTVHGEPRTFERALTPARWPDDRASCVRPPGVSAARQQGPRRFPDSARVRLTVCAPGRQSQSSDGVSHPCQTAVDTNASGRCPVGSGSSPRPAAR